MNCHIVVNVKKIYACHVNEHDNNHKLKDIIDRFCKNIDDIINILKNMKINIENYYIINNNILNNYNTKNINYEIFKNLNNINNINNNIIVKDINNIIIENNLCNKFIRIYNLNEK